MVFWNTPINEMPVLDKKKLRVFNFLYNKGIIVIRANSYNLYQVPIFNHGDRGGGGGGDASIFLQGRPEGLYAVVNHALENAYRCVLLGLLPRFVWGENSLYFDSQAGQNVWEYFFKQPSSLPSLHCSTSFPLLIRLLRHLEEDFQDSPSYIVACQIVKHFYTDLMLPGITEPIQDICLDDCIGMHFRSKSFERMNASPNIVYEAYREAIQQVLDQPGIRSDKIFLATDSELVVDKFKEMFPGQIMVTSSTRYKTTEGFVSDYETSGYQKGIEVIRDVELLSRCAYLIHGIHSNMSLFLYFLSPNQSRIDVHKYLQSD